MYAQIALQILAKFMMIEIFKLCQNEGPASTFFFSLAAFFLLLEFLKGLGFSPPSLSAISRDSF
jgi:hypothetical protein